MQRIVLRFPAARGDDPTTAPSLSLSEGWEWRQEGSQAVLLLPFDAVPHAARDLEPAQRERIVSTLAPPPWSALATPRITVSVEYSVGGRSYASRSEVEISSRPASAMLAACISLGLLLAGAWLVRRRAGRRDEPAPGLFRSPLGLIVTPLGTYSLSMAQVLTWTALTLFGCVFLWLMTDGTPQIPGPILELLGVGSGTAVLSRLANGEKQSLPLRYLRLVPSQGAPTLADLVSVEGRPSIFKFQMLGFTAVTALVLLRELYVGCHFATISDSLVTLMGLSNVTYLGNEVMQRGSWERVRQQITKLEAVAQGLQLSLASEGALQRWMQSALDQDALDQRSEGPVADSETLRAHRPLYRELLTLRALLIEIYSDAQLGSSPLAQSPPAEPPSPTPPSPAPR